MSSEPTSPKRGFRNLLKGFFNKKSDNAAHQSERNPHEPGGNNSAGTLRNPPNEQDSSESKPPFQDALRLEANHHNAASSALEGTLRALHQSTEIFPPLQAAMRTLISCLETVPAAEEHRRSYNRLLAELETLHMSMDKYQDQIEFAGLSDGTANIILSIEAEAKFLKTKRDQGRMAHIITANNDEDDLIQSYHRIETLSRQLQTNIGLGTWSIAYEQLMNTRLSALSPALRAGYNSTLAKEINRRMCTKNTRIAVLHALDSWSKNQSAANVYWMSGMAGTGKTTIAATLSDALFNQKQLGASFFCTRTSPECSSIERVVPTLAYQLARYSRPFQAAVGRVLENDPDIGTREISLQFERLLKEPLLKVKNTIPRNVVIIIDALDECDNQRGAKTLLNALFQHNPSLPVKFFITSRPEPDLRDAVLSQQTEKRNVFYLHDIEQSIVQADIELYLREELAFMPPAEYQIKRLAELAGPLFIYAATVVRYIRPGKTLANSQSRLELVLSVKPELKRQYAELDALYTTILNTALDENVLEPTEREHAERVLWTSVCAREPISIETLTDMTELNKEEVFAVLQSFLSVLHLSEGQNRVSTLHASFPEFMFSSERAGKYFCNQLVYGQRLTLRCFGIMKVQLRFNICRLESSFLPDASLTDIAQRVKTFISPSLLYACRYWGDHLISITHSCAVVTEIEEFLVERLLFWMEVLNTTGSMITGIMELQNARLWLLDDNNKTTTTALALVEDAQDFATSFTAGSIYLGTPHIYISALPLCSSSSTVYKNYRERVQGLINPKGASFNKRSSALLAIRRMPNPASCMSTSSDGALIVLGDQTGTISILDQRDGTLLRSFVGHDQHVECIAFSPDCTQFASGSFDSTIRSWSRSGYLVLGPLLGHNNGISSVSFSSDGKRIVSGGRDCIVRLWSAKEGSLIAFSSLGLNYGGRIATSVIFSANGTQIIYGLDNGTICIWDTQSNTVHAVSQSPHRTPIRFLTLLAGETLLSSSFEAPICLWNVVDWSTTTRTFDGAEHTVGVAVSPSGSHVACGSSSGDIQLWSTLDGTVVAGPLESSSGPSLSQVLAFSADGTRLFSAAHNHDLCIWNIKKSAPIKALSDYRGHTAAINSLVFSSDGKQLISCSDNLGIRICNVEDGSLALSLQMNQNNLREVSAVAFSYDNTLVASSPCDQSINLWSMQSQKSITTYSGTHTNMVYSLSFSPDGKLLASGSVDHTVCIWDVLQLVLFGEPLRKHTDIVNCLQFAPNSRYVASGSSDRTICLWNVASGQLISQLFSENESSITSLSYSKAGDYITAGDDEGNFHVWDLTEIDSDVVSLLITSGPSAQEVDAISSVAFAPNSNLIATGSENGVVHIWDCRDGELVAGPFKDHSDWVNAVVWSPDGNILASCSGDCSIRLIDLRALGNMPTQIGGDWDLREDGWVEKQSRLLFWVHPDLHPVLPRPYNSLVIGPQGPAQIDYEDLLLGEDWAQCYSGSE
ncbi:putative vegetative incompatibility protein HET-E-1 [Rhizoctonia solani 123E]|uniref:Putative vegetative incompatibility protein HET-E-1 n=1 Tax=Rhizoctonia solani 123E TaxID=1423351 RepID=A0A074RPS4_9AGAM|nr:putative vegetative incompatibility protein HET-E-1 [Rhizoctonia solani 123E]